MANPTNPGASNVTPDNPAAPGGSEVTDNPSAAQPSGAGAVSTPSASEPATLSDAIDAYVNDVAPIVNRLKAFLQSIDPADSKNHAKIGSKRVLVIPMASAMVRTSPNLSTTSADDIDAATSDVDACNVLSGSLTDLVTLVNSTGRLRLEANWRVVSGAIATARKQAPRDTVVAKDVADIDAVLATGPRAVQAAHAVVTAQAQATKADARAAKAQATLAAKTATANALQHGTGDATVVQPAPSAPASTTIR